MPGYDSTVRIPFNKGGRVGLKKGSSSSPVQNTSKRTLVADLSVNDIRMIQKAKKHGLATVTEIKETVGAGFNKKKPPTDKEIEGVLKGTITKPTGIFASEGGRVGAKAGGDGKWMQKVSASIKKRGTKGKCTPITKPGCTGKARALAKTFKKIAARRKAA